tara:strand:+ start:3729 stop:3854 length:126 start_codon:yes stop_codon:yes gene_type:complete
MRKEVFEIVDSLSRKEKKALKKRREKKHREFSRKLIREERK